MPDGLHAAGEGWGVVLSGSLFVVSQVAFLTVKLGYREGKPLTKAMWRKVRVCSTAR